MEEDAEKLLGLSGWRREGMRIVWNGKAQHCKQEQTDESFNYFLLCKMCNSVTTVLFRDHVERNVTKYG